MTMYRKRELVYYARQYEERRNAGAPPIFNQMLEESALEAAGDVLAPYVLKSACRGDTYVKLRTVDGIPCGKNMFYRLMKKFWTILECKRYDVYGQPLG